MAKPKKKRWTETGRGQKGSIFVSDKGEIVRALRTGSTVGGLQIWNVGGKTVYLKRRSELKKVLERM